MKTAKQTVKKLDAFQQRHGVFGFGYAVIKKYGEDSAGYWAALLTYYGFLALFPLLMVLTTVMHSFGDRYPKLEEAVLDGVTDYFPVLGDQLTSHIHSLQGNGPALLIGLLFTIYGARGVADVYRFGTRKVWGFKPRKKEAFADGLTKSLAIIFIGGLGFILAAVLGSITAAAGHGWGFRLVSTAANLLILFGVLVLLNKISLPKRIKTSDIWLGAFCAAVGLLVLQSLGGYILTRELKNLDALYSYFALTLGLLFWIYLQAQVIYYSNEIASVKSKKLWPRGLKETQKK